MTDPNSHRENVLAQFTKQATIFAASAELNHDDALRLLLRVAGEIHFAYPIAVLCGSKSASRQQGSEGP